MQVGTITQLFSEKQYGSIRMENGDEAIFHKHCLWDVQFSDLSEGQVVECEIQSTYKGFLAFHIRPQKSKTTI